MNYKFSSMYHCIICIIVQCTRMLWAKLGNQNNMVDPNKYVRMVFTFMLLSVCNQAKCTYLSNCQQYFTLKSTFDIFEYLWLHLLNNVGLKHDPDNQRCMLPLIGLRPYATTYVLTLQAVQEKIQSRLLGTLKLFNILTLTSILV